MVVLTLTNLSRGVLVHNVVADFDMTNFKKQKLAGKSFLANIFFLSNICWQNPKEKQLNIIQQLWHPHRNHKNLQTVIELP